jgi:hypothetical protein
MTKQIKSKIKGNHLDSITVRLEPAYYRDEMFEFRIEIRSDDDVVQRVHYVSHTHFKALAEQAFDRCVMEFKESMGWAVR